MPSHATTLAASVAGALVFVLGFMRVLRPRTLVALAFAAGIVGAALLLAVPTPAGFDPNASDKRPGGNALTVTLLPAAGVLLAISGISLVSAAAFWRPRGEGTGVSKSSG